MGIPAQVEEAATLAEQLHEKLMGNEAPQEEPIVPEEETPAEEIPADPPEPEEDIEELRKYRERYLSLKGKYDAEVPRLHQDLKEFKQSVFEKLETLHKEPPKEEPVDERRAKFIEEYGKDFVETFKEILLDDVRPLIKQDVQPVAEQLTSLEETQIKVAQENFMGYLDEHAKGWQKLWSGEDPGFEEFLKKPDPSGFYTYGQLVDMCNDNWDADRLVKIFTTYQESLVKPATPPPRNPVQEAIIAPPRQTTNVPPATEEKRIWTQDVIKEFQEADRRGKYDAETSKAMWDDLLAAMGEGRIR